MSLESNSFGRSCTFHEYTLSFVRVAYDALFGTVPFITTELFFLPDCFHIGFTLSTAHTGCAHEVWRVITTYDHHIFGWSTHDTPPHLLQPLFYIEYLHNSISQSSFLTQTTHALHVKNNFQSCRPIAWREILRWSAVSTVQPQSDNIPRQFG
jgi:hypothetical protein